MILPKGWSLLCGIILLIIPRAEAQQLYTVQGAVADLDTREPILAANIRIAGTSRGTITNANGEYRLKLEAGRHEMIFSSLGFQPETVIVSVAGDTVVDAKLRPAPIQIPEVVILAEDPAIEIIRKAIAHKRVWMDKLQTYRFDAFTRQVLRRDSAIASITESYSTGYVASGDTMREVIRQKRQTENIKLDENFASVGRIVNFNDDEISLFRSSGGASSSSYTFVGPTAPDALDNYDYKLMGTSGTGGVEIYTIRMTPKSRIKPLFNGTIIIADGTFAVMGVDIRPNETFIFPFVKNISLRYRQRFSLYDAEFWMPTDIRITGDFVIRFVGLSLPAIGIEHTSSVYDYSLNVPIPDSILGKPRRSVDSSASKFDSTFWQANEVLPLTSEERLAYKSIDSTQTLEEQFKPRGPLAAISGDAAEGIFKYLDARFNRVEGFFFGGHVTLDELTDYAEIRLSTGYGFSDLRWKYNAGATIYPLGNTTIGLAGDAYRALDHAPDADIYGGFPLTLFALIDKNDYRDYFFTTGWRAGIEITPTKRLAASVKFLNEQQYSMEITTDYSLFAREKAFRANPPITDGLMRSLLFDFRFGEEPFVFDILSRNTIGLSVEHSSPTIAASGFDFTRYEGRLQWNIPTFARKLLLSPTLRVNIAAGTSSHTLPPQRYFTVDSRIGFFAPFGVVRGSEIKEFTGDRFIAVNLEHNFRSVPFLLLDIPSFYENGIEFIIHGSAAQAWLGTTSTSAGWYYEAGLGISRILDIFRMDVNYRISAPSHLNFTISAATIF